MKRSSFKPYKKECDYSYALGAYATIELIASRPADVQSVIAHPSYEGDGKLFDLCRARGIPVLRDDRLFQLVSPKENTYVLGVFGKYRGAIGAGKPHIVLVHPGDMGNLGAIIRTAAALGLRDLAIITPAADIWHPKTVRASMGALFRIEFEQFDDIDGYRGRFPGHRLYPFMLDGKTELYPGFRPERERYSLVFGNEASGLEPRFHDLGVSVRIPQAAHVDSLNLSVAVGIGAYLFASPTMDNDR